MSARLWLEDVERELKSSKLPRREIARLVAELSDHFADAMSPLVHLEEENLRMEASVVETLGSPAEIAETAVREFRRRRNLLSRSRLAAFCAFVLLPLPALCLAWATSIAVLMLGGEVLSWFDMADPPVGEVMPAETTPTEVFAMYAVMIVLLVGPAAGVAAVFGRLARRTRHHWRWGLAACLLVALGTGSIFCSATFSDLPGKSTVGFGIGMNKALFRLSGLGQFLVPLATGLLVLRRTARWEGQTSG